MNAKIVSKKNSHTNVATTEKVWRAGCLKNADFVAILKDCAKRRDLTRGRKIHEHILKEGLVHKDIYIGSSLISLYVKCDKISKAQEVFDELPIRNVVSWTSLISGYVQCEYSEIALNLFDQMRYDGISPNGLTFSCALKACGNIQLVRKGEEIHAEIQGSLENDVLLGTSLVDMYAKCGFLEKAREVFETLKSRDVVAWTTLITAYRQHGLWEESLYCFEKMQCDGITPNIVTLICILKVCGSAQALDKGEKIHLQIIRESLLEKDVLVGNALVDMYAKCGEIAKAYQVFENLKDRDLISWTSLMGGYTQHGYGKEAVQCFELMQREGFLPNSVTFISILKACGSIGAIDKGKQIHAEIVNESSLEEDISIGNVLIDMYARCGAHEKAQEVFDKLPFHDVVSWTTLISGYVQLGSDNLVIDLFNKMVCEGIEPNLVTFTVLLNGCSHSGLLDLARLYGESMSKSYGMIPMLKQNTCMVDVFARAGHFDEALAIIEKMPTSDYLPLWTALLSACQKWGNKKLALLAFEHALQLDENYASSYIGMCNVYSSENIEDAKILWNNNNDYSSS